MSPLLPPLLLLLLLPPLLPTACSANANVHAYYYLWYGNPATDGRFLHWDHEVLPHWSPAVRARHPHGPASRHAAADGVIHAPFYPALGAYSSRDAATLDAHMRELIRAGVGTVVLSWWGQAAREGTSDTQGVQTDAVIAQVVAAVERVERIGDGGPGMRFAVHMEPYPGRTHTSVQEDAEYLVARFGASDAWLRIDGRRVFYVYDSYHIGVEDWRSVLGVPERATGPPAVRDGFFIALWLNRDGGELASRGGFDGVYTYFASDGFVYGSSTRNWKHMRAFCVEKGLLFVPSVGPGYNDEGIRPWNAHNTKSREGGAYYDRMWRAALDSGAEYVSITSYNEWGEGTQIESAAARSTAPNTGGKKVYLEYAEGEPGKYVDATRKWADALGARGGKSSGGGRSSSSSSGRGDDDL
jgi:glycoprotein endo-alpha-1,2-mannosidase